MSDKEDRPRTAGFDIYQSEIILNVIDSYLEESRRGQRYFNIAVATWITLHTAYDIYRTFF